MSYSIAGSSASAAETETLMATLRVSVSAADKYDAYIMSAQSGAMSGNSASTSLTTPGQAIFAFRNGTDSVFVVDRLRVRLVVTTPFGTAQEIGANAVVCNAVTTSWGGGTTLTPCRKYSGGAASSVVSGDARICAAATLTAPSSGATPLARVFLELTGWSQQSAIRGNDFTSEWTSRKTSPIVLRRNDAIAVRNQIATVAGGIIRAKIDMEWREYASWP